MVPTSEKSSSSESAITEQEIEQKLLFLKAKKKAKRLAKTEMDEKIARLRKEMKANNIEKKGLHSEVKAVCIKGGGNEYSRKTIKQDFAMGIKELDQENATEEYQDTC